MITIIMRLKKNWTFINLRKVFGQVVKHPHSEITDKKILEYNRLLILAFVDFHEELNSKNEVLDKRRIDSR